MTIAACVAGALAGIGAGIAIGAGLWSSKTPAAAAATPALGTSRLYVVDGKSGYATRGPGETWTVTFRNALDVLWFADRPSRASGNMTVGQLVSSWTSLFGSSPPNGAMLAPAGPPGHHPTAVKLSDPRFSPAGNTFSVTLKPDKGETVADAAWLSKLTRAAAGANGRLVLFIDGSDPTYTVTVLAPPNYTFGPRSPLTQFCGSETALTQTSVSSAGTATYVGSMDHHQNGDCDNNFARVQWFISDPSGNPAGGLALNIAADGTVTCQNSAVQPQFNNCTIISQSQGAVEVAVSGLASGSG